MGFPCCKCFSSTTAEAALRQWWLEQGVLPGNQGPKGFRVWIPVLFCTGRVNLYALLHFFKTRFLFYKMGLIIPATMGLSENTQKLLSSLRHRAGTQRVTLITSGRHFIFAPEMTWQEKSADNHPGGKWEAGAGGNRWLWAKGTGGGHEEPLLEAALTWPSEEPSSSRATYSL